MSAPPFGEIIEGDCADAMRRLPDRCVDLAYLDPPFFTQAVRRDRGGAFDDRWPSVGAYLAFMRTRVEQVHRLLAPMGAILLHCDWRTSHHLRLLLDAIFGAERFLNQLVWTYGLGGSSPRRFARKHDDILYYARGPEWYFEPPRVPATSQRLRGETKKATDVIDIPSINNMAAERTGYPTQKPLALLDLLVGAACPPDGAVLDPFCGSGTTLVAAARSGRRWLGIDRSPDAVAIARRRCGSECGSSVPAPAGAV